VKNIVRNRGETVVLEDLPLTDATTYALMARGDTLGVFQLDGGPMRALLRSMRPDQFADICAAGAARAPRRAARPRAAAGVGARPGGGAGGGGGAGRGGGGGGGGGGGSR